MTKSEETADLSEAPTLDLEVPHCTNPLCDADRPVVVANALVCQSCWCDYYVPKGLNVGDL